MENCDLPLSDLLVSQDAAISSADGSGGAAGSPVVGWSTGLQSLHLAAIGLLFDILNGELATGSLNLSEAV